MIWSHKYVTFSISSSEISVPIEISAAALTSSSTSSGRMLDKSESAVFVLNPEIFQNINSTQNGKDLQLLVSNVLKHLNVTSSNTSMTNQ